MELLSIGKAVSRTAGCAEREQVARPGRGELPVRPHSVGCGAPGGTALSWRLHRDERGWRAFVSFVHQPANNGTLDAEHGAIASTSTSTICR